MMAVVAMVQHDNVSRLWHAGEHVNGHRHEPALFFRLSQFKFCMAATTCAVDTIVFSLYYRSIMLASRQTFTACCCTCCCARVSSGTGGCWP